MNALVRVGELPTFAPVPEVMQRRDILLVACQAVRSIEDQMDADAAAEILGQATAVVRIVEKSRGEIKGPVLDLGRAIDAVAKDITAPLAIEATRIQRLIGSFLESQRQARAVEEARIRAEEAKRMAEARKITDDRQAADAMRAAVHVTEMAIAATAPPKIEGTSLRMQTNVEVFDPPALYAARPDLVELKPRIAAIKEALFATPTLPGVRITQTPMASIRTPHAQP